MESNAYRVRRRDRPGPGLALRSHGDFAGAATRRERRGGGAEAGGAGRARGAAAARGGRRHGIQGRRRKGPDPQIRVIDAEEISQLPAPPNRNISEILSYQPGIFVAPLSRNDANWGSNGGLGPKYNSYLLDGLPIDSFIDGTSLDPWALSRVEIQRGPAAVMYSNYLAMDFAGNTTPLAGITNFVLREKVDAPVTRLQAGLGSWATVNAQAYTQGRSGDLHYFFGGSWEHADYTNYGAPGSWLDMQQFPQYTSVRLYGKTTFFFGGPEQTDQSVSVFAHYYGHSGAVGRPNRDFAYGYGTINAVYTLSSPPR